MREIYDLFPSGDAYWNPLARGRFVDERWPEIEPLGATLGESLATVHERLECYIREHPDVFGANTDW